MTFRFISIFLLTLASISQADTGDDFFQAYARFEDVWAAGNYADAADLAARALELGIEKYGEGSDKVALLTHNYAYALMYAGDFERSGEMFAAAESRYAQVYGDTAPELISLYINSAASSAAQRKPRDCMRKFDRAESLTRKNFQSETSVYADQLLKLGQAYATHPCNKSGERAEQYVLEAYKLYEQLPQISPYQLSIAAFIVGKVRMGRADYDGALEFFQEALAVSEKAGGEDALDLQIMHLYAAISSRSLGQEDADAEHCRRAANIDTGDFERPPKPIRKVAPRFPMSLLGRGAEGCVLVEFAIDPCGRLSDFEATKLNGPKGFVEPALEAVRNFQFLPAVADGRLVASKSQHLITFKIEGREHVPVCENLRPL